MRAASLTLAVLLAPGALAKDRTDADRVLRTRFSYTASVPTVPSGTKALDIWLPIPSDSELQTVSNLSVTGVSSYQVTTEPKHGNRMVYVRLAQPTGAPTMVVSFDVARKTGGVAGAPKADPRAYLAPDRLVPIGGRYAEIAEEVTHGESTTLQKMLAIYNHTVANMEYDYNKDSPKLGQGDVAFVCDYKKGNCSDLHSYVISLARSEGIPAFLEYGFPLTGIPVPNPVPAKGKIGGYHCWTWFWDKDKGWIPLDASDGRRWLDAKHPEVKEKLGSQLVLERSAVAFSRGRDIVLNPPQKQMPLNNFIYPYAEADGDSIEAKWDLSYELIAEGSAPVASPDMQRQIDELRQLVLDQRKEIDALKAGQPTPPAKAVSTSTGGNVQVYGFVRTDLAHDSGQMNPNGQFPFFVQSPSNASQGGTNDQFTLHPRLTRIGLNAYAAPNAIPGWKAMGKIELDFQGGGSESRPTPRGRHLYLQLQRGPSTWLLGQTSDLISPLFPSPNDDSLMWNAGNLGDRRPQIRYVHQQQGGYPATFGIALGATGAIDAKDLDSNGVRDGEDSGMPHLQARIGVSGANGGVGIWGHIGREEVTLPVAGQTSFDTNSLGIDWSWTFGRVGFMGEAWMGRNLSDFRGGIGQGVNTGAGTEIESRGGWAELGFLVNPRHRLAVGYTIDDPEDADVPANGRTKNQAWYLHNKWQLGGNLELGLNYLYWTTDFNGLSRGVNNRFNLFVSQKF